MSLSPRNKANLKLSLLPPASSSLHHSQSPKAKAPVACDHRRRGCGDGNDDEEGFKLPYLNSGGSKMSGLEQECSMCGDVGFPTELFQCKKCLHRFQHTYCSRYYPSIPDLDVCDWCSQETNPSTGSSTAVTTTMTGSTKTPRISKPGPPPPSLVTNLGKRKVVAAPSSSSPRKNCSSSSEPHNKSSKLNNTMIKSSRGDRNSNTTTTTTRRSSEVTDLKVEEEEHKDALELLLEVAQKVAEGQMINSCSHGDGGIGVKQQPSTCWDNTKQDVQLQLPHKQHHQTQAQQVLASRNTTASNNNNNNNKGEGRPGSLKGGTMIQGSSLLVAASSSKRQKLDINGATGGSGSSSLGGGGGVKQVGPASSTGNKEHKLQLTTSRSIGRRYKLLSDVLCTKVAASNS